jgi:hypothetical protein
MKHSIIALLFSFALIHCSKQGSSPVEPLPEPLFMTSIDSIVISDSTILAFAYGDSKYPEGFYTENLSGIIYYDNTHDIIPSSQRVGHPYELSTDDIAQARLWSESSALNRSRHWELESESETNKYFQFRRVRVGDPDRLSRIHKLSYVDRSMFLLDPLDPSPIFAKLNTRPVDSSSVRSLIEYLWFVDNYDLYGAIALTGVVRQSVDTVQYVLYNIQLVGGDFGIRDKVYLYRSLYSVSTETGFVQMLKKTLRTVDGKLN